MLRKIIIILPVTLIVALTVVAEDNRDGKDIVGIKGTSPTLVIEGILNFGPEYILPFSERVPPPNCISKRPGRYTRYDWSEAIDVTWGAGLPDGTKQYIFSTYWSIIDNTFACFDDLSADVWSNVYNLYYPEVSAGGVSRGRFSAILTHATMNLREGHTWGRDLGVYGTELLPGVPLMYIGGWGEVGHFGAALTPLPDNRLLVYDVVESHPLGLNPGDIILGYDGIPWDELYPQLLEAELPLTGWNWGASDPSFTHVMLMSAGMNWHLFDVIDIEKYGTREIQHLSTSLLEGHDMNLYATEQLDVPGVPKPSSIYISSGTIDATEIGYIYIYGASTVEPASFSSYIWTYLNSETNRGLIIDLRFNMGGNPFGFFEGLEFLFDEYVEVLGFGDRCSPSDHLAMCNNISPDTYPIDGDPGTFYDRPIAVIVGPGAISGGDMLALALAHHPRAKFFGRPTRAAFNSAMYTQLNPDFLLRCADQACYLAWQPTQYLTHDIFPGATDFPWLDYEDVWLTQEGVAQNQDDVVEAALAWIISFDLDQDGIVNEEDNCPEYPNPLQEDFDEDLIGNVCDNCPEVYNPDQTDADGNDIGDACQHVCGDPDGDENTNILDIVYMINYLYKNGPAPVSPNESDVNSDSYINILDIVYLINYIYKNGPEPTCP